MNSLFPVADFDDPHDAAVLSPHPDPRLPVIERDLAESLIAKADSDLFVQRPFHPSHYNLFGKSSLEGIVDVLSDASVAELDRVWLCALVLR